jgi:hypothetical protein
MQRYTLALAAFIAAAALSGATKPALAIDYPWCAQYGGADDGGRNCGFVSYEQCMLTISGMGGFCERNLYYNSSASEKPRAKRKRPPQG